MSVSWPPIVKRALDRSQAERIVVDLLSQGGVTVGGNAPYDIQVHDRRFYGRVVRQGTLGLGEAYMDGWWDSERLDETITRLLHARAESGVQRNPTTWLHRLKGKAFNLQRLSRAFEVGKRHYDIGNDLYRAMLDSTMAYTCGYWRNADNLEQAQQAKLDLVCRKAGLEPGMKVLELGCGWGSFAKYAAEHYGVEVTGYTVSKEQVALGRERCAGLPVELRLEDYRNAQGSFDAVVSIGIMEHVGPRNYRAYMQTAARCLAPGGISFIHTIGANTSRDLIDPWFHRYIFPNAVAPSMARLAKATEGLFVLEDVHNIGPDYDRTLMAWYQNVERAWPELGRRYDERFHRMWTYYLLTSAAAFRSRHQQLYQLVTTGPGTPQRGVRLG